MKKSVATAAVLSLFFVTFASAQTIRFTSNTIIETLVSADSFGQCMVYIDRDLRGPTNGACRGTRAGSHMTFSCDGSIQDKEVANRMFEIAQVAQFANRKVRFEIDTSKQIDGYCLVTRMDIE